MNFVRTSLVVAIAMLSVACFQRSDNANNGVVVSSPTPQLTDKPDHIALALFEVARSGTWNRLGDLCLPGGKSDRSARDICAMAKTAGGDRYTFRRDFFQGGMDGTSVIDGNKATLKIKYAKKLTKTAVLTLTEVDGRWYLYSLEQK